MRVVNGSLNSYHGRFVTPWVNLDIFVLSPCLSCLQIQIGKENVEIIDV